jgi:hypothetical protein
LESVLSCSRKPLCGEVSAAKRPRWSSLGQSPVATAVVQEGLAPLIFAGHDLTHEDFVVTSR